MRVAASFCKTYPGSQITLQISQPGEDESIASTWTQPAVIECSQLPGERFSSPNFLRFRIAYIEALKKAHQLFTPQSPDNRIEPSREPIRIETDGYLFFAAPNREAQGSNIEPRAPKLFVTHEEATRYVGETPTRTEVRALYEKLVGIEPDSPALVPITLTAQHDFEPKDQILLQARRILSRYRSQSSPRALPQEQHTLFCALAEAKKDGNHPLYKEIRDFLVETNMGLVTSFCRAQSSKWSTSSHISEYIQDSKITLIRAVENFDPAVGFAFSTYLTRCLRNQVLHTIKKQSSIYIPADVRVDILRLNNAFYELQQTLGRIPSNREVASHLDMTPEKIENLRMAKKLLDPISLTPRPDISGDAVTELGEDQASLRLVQSALVAKEPPLDEAMIESESVSDMRKLLQKLSEEEQRVVRSTFGMDEEPLNKVAADLNMSYSRAKSLGRKAMRKLRQYATRELEGSLG